MPPKRAQKAQTASNKQKDEAFAKRTTFYVNMEWEPGVPQGQGTYLRGHMHVESLEPQKKTQEFSIVLIHGDYHSSQIWLTKPNGEPGWASYFLNRGFQVYLVDLPGTGKSNYLRGDEISNTEVKSLKAAQVEKELTAMENFNEPCDLRWPTVLKHDKWPGTGLRSDGPFTRYCASLTPLYFSQEERQTLAQNALCKLLNTTGKAVLIGEGTGATAAWLAADVAPECVAGVVAIEPPGPPFCASTIQRNNKRKYDTFTTFDPKRLKYGLSNIPLTFDPPVRPEMGPDGEPTGQHPLDLALYVHMDTRKQVVLQYSPGNIPERFLFSQNITNGPGTSHIRKLINLQKMRHVIFTGEASSHSAYDMTTLYFMKQAGLEVDCGFLERYGTRGNGHLMFLETNSDDVAALVTRWILNKAGQINEPDVTIVSQEIVNQPTDTQEESNRCSKRAKTMTAYGLQPYSVSANNTDLVDLTEEVQHATKFCPNESLHSDHKKKYVRFDLPDGTMPSASAPPPELEVRLPPPTPQPDTSMNSSEANEGRYASAERLEHFNYPTTPAATVAELANPWNDMHSTQDALLITSYRPTNANGEQAQEPEWQQIDNDNYFTSSRFQFSETSFAGEDGRPQQASPAQTSINSSQAPFQQHDLPSLAAAEDDSYSQFNLYLYLQQNGPPSIPLAQVPRLMPSFPSSANFSAHRPTEFQRGPARQDDDWRRNVQPVDFQYDFSGLSAEDMKSIADSLNVPTQQDE